MTWPIPTVLSLRIKQRLERAIEAEAFSRPEDLPQPAPAVRAANGKQRHVLHEKLGLREPPKATGGAYLIRGPSPDEAPFMGHRHETTGRTEVTLDGVQLPAKYQPYRAEREFPHGRHPPTADSPTGQFRKPPDDRGLSFGLVRP
mmetsp:Transcript_58310/g.181131  ORF Transcript_58310/g.181131 Transcript_58310/m.181131 type:complete len:145 (-) Transcript_58310:57-491(-)